MPALLNNLLIFGRVLRRAGLDIHMGRLLDVVEALPHVNIASRDDVYHTCRALLVHRHEDLAIFDRVFDAFWRAHGSFTTTDRRPRDDRPEQSAASTLQDQEAPPADEAEIETAEGAIATWSDLSTLGHKDFAEFSDNEVALARAALDRLEWSPGEKRTRRWVPGRGSRVDLRRALHRSVRTGGDVLKLPRRRRRTRVRPIVLICDISGSMERYSRVLLHFAHSLRHRHGLVEAFVFSTELTRITRELRTRGIDQAIAAVSGSVRDWSGGTRIGEALRHLQQRWMRRALNGGPVVLLISDGWDRGDPDVLREQIKRLQRGSHRLIWLNPLIGTVGYSPLTRGMRAALPFVDDFLPARTLNNLADLAIHLNALSRHAA